MAVVYTVRRKDNSRDFELDIDKFIDGLGYGVYRGDVLEEQYPEEGDCLVLYDPERIGRGISVVCIEGGFELRIIIPTVREEIRMFFELIERLVGQMGECVISDCCNNETVSSADFLRLKSELEKDSLDTLMKSMKLKILLGDDEYGCLTYQCAKYPLHFNKDMCEKISASHDPLEAFGDVIHGCQSTQARMLSPLICNTPYGVTGVYAVDECRQIVPLLPSVPSALWGEDGNAPEVDRWIAVHLENDILKEADYDSFVSAVKGNSSFFDGACVLAEKISPETVRAIFSKELSK